MVIIGLIPKFKQYFTNFHHINNLKGQTGSGKSYSVVGYGKNRGIVPMVCEEIFKNSQSIKETAVEV